MESIGDLNGREGGVREVKLDDVATSQPYVVCDGESTYVFPSDGNGDEIVFNIVPNVLNIAENLVFRLKPLRILRI
ncbi:hypothetical protein Tco_0692303 [Tanacetum coccineum]